MGLIQSLNEDRAEPRVSTADIGRDSSLSARVLQVANSPLYARPQPIASIEEAAIVLGSRTMRTLALAAGVTGQFSFGRHAEGFDLRGFWLHAIATAACARVLGRHAGVNTDIAFAAGLLHDIGRIALAACCADRYAEVLAVKRRRDCSDLEAERDVLGIDHATVGQAVVQRWKFPRVIQEAVASHHAPPAAEALSLAALVHVSDVIIHALDVAGAEDERVGLMDPAAWGRLDMGWPEFQDRLAEIEREAKAAAALIAGPHA